jgi:hypothetical protein
MLLTDIYMPHMNGFELCEKVLELDVNIRMCFMSSAEVNVEALPFYYYIVRSLFTLLWGMMLFSLLIGKLNANVAPLPSLLFSAHILPS